jgi:hypothetical protein
MGRYLFITLVTLIVFSAFSVSDALYSQVSVSGNVYDASTKKPVAGVQVEIPELRRESTTDSEGAFSFPPLNFESLAIRFRLEGYRTSHVTILYDSVINSKGLNVYLKPLESVTDTIDVSEMYYKKNEDIHTSSTYAVYEELRKSPGTVEDIIKYFQTSPGVTFASDLDNDLIVRGGSPIENLTLFGGVEILNPNHYGPPGSTSGALSFINLKFVDEVNFYSGGFPVKYGGRISSVMDIKLKQGDSKRHWRDLYVSFTGFGGFFEGPIDSKTTYMFSARRSYLELIRKNLNMDYIPNFWDFNLKLERKVSTNDRISLVGMYAIDKTHPYDILKDSTNTDETPVNLKLFNAGFNYQHEKKNEFLRFTISDSYSDYDAGLRDFELKIKDNQLNLCGEFKITLNNTLKIDAAADIKYIYSDYDVFSDYYVSPTGYFIPEVSYSKYLNTFKFDASVNFIADLIKRKLNISAGLRVDYVDYMKSGLSVSPRMGLSYKLQPITAINFSAGLYSQPPEYLWLLSGTNKDRLTNIFAKEVILGIEHYFSSDVRVNLEGYLKHYSAYPVSLYDPYYIYINISGLYPNFLTDAQSNGRGYFAGAELTAQKKNSGYGLYGTLNLSYMKSSFKATEGGYQPGRFDNGLSATLIAGYRFKFDFIFSFRLRYTEGKHYTPFDPERSYQLGYGMYDMNFYNKLRLPYYMRLDIRIDKYFKFGNTQLIAYVELWNALDRKNVYDYDWGFNSAHAEYHWARIPVIGISYRF